VTNVKILNAYWQPLDFELPRAGKAGENPWRRWIDTALDSPHDILQWENYRQQNAFEQAELILYAALDPAVASRARKGECVKCFDHFDLLQTTRN